ncbi:MAG: sigma-70 family RNA polymerase sigma factor [Clostridia bacterium]|nr:sigma-70 family RNA polymerase sigma factor [Clostridia bacterium]
MNEIEFNNLIKRIAKDEKCFDKLYQYYFAKIVLFLRSKYGTKVNGADIAQDFFVMLLSNNVGHIKYPNAYVYKVCSNMAYHKLGVYNSETQLLETIPTPLPPEYDDTIDRALSTLDTLELEIIKLHIYYGYSLKEIAIDTGQNYSTIRSTYNRSMKKLKEKLK